MITYDAATAAILNGRLKDAWDGSIELVASDEPGRLSIVAWEPAKRKIVLHRTIRESGHFPYFASKFQPTLRVLERVYCSDTDLSKAKTISINLDDIPSPEGVAYVSGRGEDHLLIPDPNFVRSDAYVGLKTAYSNVLQWKERIPVAFWRGGTSGRWLDGKWRNLPRLNLARYSLRNPQIDAGITHVTQLPEEAAREIASEGLIRGRVPAELFKYYRAHVVIDGNSWPTGFYCALLTGAPVLKVESPFGYRQWYYERLNAWEHYIPVKADLSDLAEKSAWVLSDGARAERVGSAGRSVAFKMTVDSEIETAAHRIAEVLAA